MPQELPTQAVILAGGFGTRLRSVVQDVPKPMANIKGRPFLCYVLDYCRQYGICQVVLAVGYLHEVIRQYFGNEYKGIALTYAIEDKPLGTGGAIRQALTYCQPDEPAFVLNGDTLFAADLGQLYHTYTQSRADIAIALCSLRNFDRYGVVETDEEGRVTVFCEKQYREAGNINGGIYLLSPLLLRDFPVKFSFEKAVLAAHVRDYRLYAYASHAYFIDIGIPEDYARAGEELSS